MPRTASLFGKRAKDSEENLKKLPVVVVFPFGIGNALAKVCDRSRAAVRETIYMERLLFVLLILYSLIVSPMPASAGSQTWLVRAGDNLESIAATLGIPKEEIKKHNPRISDNNLQIDQNASARR